MPFSLGFGALARHLETARYIAPPGVPANAGSATKRSLLQRVYDAVTEVDGGIRHEHNPEWGA